MRARPARAAPPALERCIRIRDDAAELRRTRMTNALTLVIGNKNYSSWSLRPWIFLRHYGVAFDEVRLPLETPEFRTGIARWSPSGRVPVLHHDGQVIWDSLAICEYVDRQVLDGRAWPRERGALGQALSLVAEMHSGFAAMRSQLPMNCRRRPDAYRWNADAQRDIDRIQQVWRDTRARHGQGGDFLCGEYGLVDAMFAPVAVRFRGYGVACDPVSAAYRDALLALPAFREWDAAATSEPEHIVKYETLAAV
jgi:glutathione S-transferase